MITEYNIFDAFLILVFIVALFYLLRRGRTTKDTLLEREKQLRTLIDALPDFINFKDGDGRWLEANEFALRLFHLENVPFEGKKDSDLAEFTPFYREALIACEYYDELAWDSRKISRAEEVIPQPDGTYKTFDTIKVPTFHEDGSRKGLVVIGRDVTERKEAEEALKEKEERYRTLAEASPAAILVHQEGIVRFVNQAGVKLMGATFPEQIIGRPVLAFVHPDYRNVVKGRIQKTANDYQELMEEKFIRLDGKAIDA